MDSILSIQSHVVYGYVGNKAAAYPLQAMGFDVWPINTVQFSNHTGYGKWQGEIFSSDHILKLVDGIFELGHQSKCKAILSGYMGSGDICDAVSQIVRKFKDYNPNIIYLCDPVIGNTSCYVKPEVLKFFQSHLSADIITPNQYEAEILSGMTIKSVEDLKAVANHFHRLGIKVVVITGIKFHGDAELHTFASDGRDYFIIGTKEYNFEIHMSGTGDLFSSVFLGSYMKHHNLSLALRCATLMLQRALEATFISKERELQILSVKYDLVETESWPKIKISESYEKNS